MKVERQLAPWLVGAKITTVGKVAERRPLKGGARQRRMHRDQRREQLLEACLVSFARDGLEMTTMDSIAATAGVSKPLVYRHFHNRYEALLAVVDQQSERLLHTLGIDSDECQLHDFQALTTTFFRFASDSPASFRLLFQLVDAAAGAAKRKVDQLRDRVGRAFVASLLFEVQQPDQARPAISGPDSTWLAGVVSSIVEGVAAGLAKDEDPTLRAAALCHLLRPEGVTAALREVRGSASLALAT